MLARQTRISGMEHYSMLLVCGGAPIGSRHLGGADCLREQRDDRPKPVALQVQAGQVCQHTVHLPTATDLRLSGEGQGGGGTRGGLLLRMGAVRPPTARPTGQMVAIGRSATRGYRMLKCLCAYMSLGHAYMVCPYAYWVCQTG